jgi:hypothetical protein
VTSTDYKKLAEDYDGVLRGLASYLGAGGYNSDGLIDPKVADDKIRWGIEHLLPGCLYSNVQLLKVKILEELEVPKGPNELRNILKVREEDLFYVNSVLRRR